MFVYNAIGNIILYEYDKTNISVDLSNQPTGIYYLKVSTNGTSKYLKLIRHESK